MTREEEIKQVAYSQYCNSESICFTLMCDSFEQGAKWADNNSKSPWISVKDDLPCNHKELLLSTGHHTVSVFICKKGGACGIDNMIIRNGKWEWEAWKEDYIYWMPIPKLPK